MRGCDVDEISLLYYYFSNKGNEAKIPLWGIKDQVVRMTLVVNCDVIGFSLDDLRTAGRTTRGGLFGVLSSAPKKPPNLAIQLSLLSPPGS